MKPKPKSFTLSKIERAKSPILHVDGERVSTAYLVGLAADEKLPLYLKLPDSERNYLAGFTVHDGNESRYAASLNHEKPGAYVRIGDPEALKGVHMSLSGDDDLATVSPKRIKYIVMDHRCPRFDGGHMADYPPALVSADQGESSPGTWVVFTDDLERLGIVVDSSPVPDASGDDTQDKSTVKAVTGASGADSQEESTAEATSAPETANTRAAKSRDEKMWLHAAVYALALQREKEKGNDRFPDEHGASAVVARHLKWQTEGKPDKPPSAQSPDTFVRAFRTGERILGGDAQPEGEDTRALFAGALTLKKAMAFLAAEVYRNDSPAIRAERILGHLDGAPLKVKPTAGGIEDALKEGMG